MSHGFSQSVTVIDGMRSWQYVKLGSMRPFVNGWRSLRGAVRRSHSMQGTAVRSRASVCPLHRATSWGSVMSGDFRGLANVRQERPNGFDARVLRLAFLDLPQRGERHARQHRKRPDLTAAKVSDGR